MFFVIDVLINCRFSLLQVSFLIFSYQSSSNSMSVSRYRILSNVKIILGPFFSNFVYESQLGVQLF